MKIEALPLDGCWLLVPEPHVDERGSFTRTWCREEVAPYGIDVDVAQSSVSWNARRGTLRGMHLQREPHGEGKLVRVTAGAVHDVLVDLRPGPGRLRWCAVELTATTRRAVWAPPGVAHGFLTLVDATEVSYQMSYPYVPEAADGVRWDDPAIGIAWPFPPEVVSDRDQTWPDVTP